MSRLFDVDVAREGDELTVRWRGEGLAGVGVTVVAGAEPDGLRVAHPGAAAPGSAGDRGPVRAEHPGADVGEVRLPVDRRRHYVLVEPATGGGVLAAERLVPLGGTLNFRDLGGYPAVGGRRVRWGRVFRSDALAGLTAEDLDVLTLLGVGVVCDLRRADERAEEPSVLPPGVEVVPLPMGGTGRDDLRTLTRILGGDLAEFGVDDMVAVYESILADFAGGFGEVVARAAEADRRPVLFHCTAGKDRTGLAAALVLSVLGVERPTVIEDYALTTRFRSARRLEEVGPQLEAAGVEVRRVLAYFTAQPEVMARVLALVDERWGGVEGYLCGPAGLPAATLERLRRALLT